MPFVAACSTNADSHQALREVCTQAVNDLGSSPDLAMLFYSPHHLRAVSELAKKAHPTLQAQCLIGCPGETIVGNAREIENGPAMSLWLSKWSQPVRMTPFHLYLERTSEGGSILGWPDALVEAQLEESAIIMVADPYTFPPDVFLKSVNNDQPGLRVMGGMASGVNAPGECKMMQDGWQIDQGALGVLLEGPIGVRPVVSQGCRPIGKHMVITRAEKNIIQELGGKSPLEQLQELWQGLPPHEQELMQQGFHVGRVMNEHQGEFYQGDFLIRNVMGLDRDTGALVMADRFRVGQTVQFHVRDAESADQDLHDLLKMDIAAHEKKPSGALLFSCNGRGTRLFEKPNHDAQSIQEEAGAIPIAGFFAQGELGPVGNQNFIHGFTASVVLFED